MKKNLFLISVAALAFAACTNETTEYVGDTSPTAREIAFSPLAQPNTRAAVESTTFPTDMTMKVSAYDAIASKNFFSDVTFSHSSATWKGGKYWPLTEATINFLAYAGFTEGTATWNATNPASAVTLAMGDNKTAQNDLMYACGTGTVTQTGNLLDFPTNVPMQFKHAQALIKFKVKAGDASTAGALTINSITLNDVSCQGTFTVTHANWNKTKAQRDAAAGSLDGSVSGVWSAYDTYVGNIAAVKAAGYSALSTSSQDYASLMVVPAQGMSSFTINYTVDGNAYDYTYTPATTTLAQATKYIYDITLTLHEIEIAPTVVDWVDGGTEHIDIPTPSFTFDGLGTHTGTFDIAKDAGTYTCFIKGLTVGKTYDIDATVLDTNPGFTFGASITPDANGVGTLTFTATENTTGTPRLKGIRLKDHDDASKFSDLTIRQAN